MKCSYTKILGWLECAGKQLPQTNRQSEEFEIERSAPNKQVQRTTKREVTLSCERQPVANLKR